MQQATILIPDISGYTRFLTKTELSHSTHVINELLQVIADTVQHRFTLAEIEGDALLTYAKGKVPREEVEAICREAFFNFHYFLKIIERDSVCRCGACQGATQLSLKFVVHFGYFDEVKIAQFTKLSGPDMIIAHRLLKNSVPEQEYMLFTDDYLKGGVEGSNEFTWRHGNDLYDIIGNVNYRYATLNHLLAEVSSPESREDLMQLFGLSRSLEIEIDAPVKEVHSILTDHSQKVNFVQGLRNVQYESAINRVGSSHVCEFDGDTFDIQTLQDAGDSQDITYIEKAHAVNSGHTMLTYYEMKHIDDGRTLLIFRALTGDRKALPADMEEQVYQQSAGNLEGLKRYVESLTTGSRKAG